MLIRKKERQINVKEDTIKCLCILPIWLLLFHASTLTWTLFGNVSASFLLKLIYCDFLVFLLVAFFYITTSHALFYFRQLSALILLGVFINIWVTPIIYILKSPVQECISILYFLTIVATVYTALRYSEKANHSLDHSNRSKKMNKLYLAAPALFYILPHFFPNSDSRLLIISMVFFIPFCLLLFFFVNQFKHHLKSTNK